MALNRANNSRYIKVSCNTCGTPFYTDKYALRRTKHSYCSKQCNISLKQKGQRPHNFIGKENYPTFNCEWCGVLFKRTPSQAKIYKHHFCSDKCNGLWKAKNLVGALIYNWKGGYDGYYGEDWKIQKRLCLLRDKNICNKCKKSAKEKGKNMDIDHKIPFEAFNGNWKEANKLDNLWALCASCHSIKTNWQTKLGKMSILQWQIELNKWLPTFILDNSF